MDSRLRKIRYERKFVVMAELEDPGRVPVPGFAEPDEGILVRVVDEQAKGTSEVPALTFHASPGFSLAQWESDRERVASEILSAAEPWLGSGILAHQIHGWQFSRPVTTWPEPCLVLTDAPPLILAGDAFGGPRPAGCPPLGPGSCRGFGRYGFPLRGQPSSRSNSAGPTVTIPR